MLEKIHIHISMLSALVTIIYGIVTGMSLAETALPVIIAIIVFYFVGVVVKNYLNKTVFILEEPILDAEEIIGEPAVEIEIETDEDDLADDEEEELY